MQRCVATLHLPSSFVIYLVGNSQSYCHPLKETSIQQAGFENYNQLTLAFIGVIVGASCALALAAFAYENFDNHEASNLNQPLTSADKDYALETLGRDSVYHFFVGKSCWGWLIVLATVAFQGWVLFFFVDGSEIDLSDDKVDVVYTWKCTRDKETCIDTKDLDGQGWLACTLVLILYLLEDVINGAKMILLCAKQRFDLNDRIRFFIGGTILTTITLLTIPCLYQPFTTSPLPPVSTFGLIICSFICSHRECLQNVLSRHTHAALFLWYSLIQAIPTSS